MRHILLGSVAFAALFAGAAQAADLPRRAAAPAPIYAAPFFTWQGFYVGAQIGYGWGTDRVREFTGAGAKTVGVTATDIDARPDGVVGGLHAGYNAQFSSAFVVGVEADIEATSQRRTYVGNNYGFGFPAPQNYSSRTPWEGSLRARVGYAAGTALFYVTGGVAFAQLQHLYQTAGIQQTNSTTRAGWTLGAGVEYAFSPNWSARLEYRYSDFGRTTDVMTPAATGIAFFPGFQYRHKETQNAVRVGLSYRFASPVGAVVAKY